MKLLGAGWKPAIHNAGKMPALQILAVHNAGKMPALLDACGTYLFALEFNFLFLVRNFEFAQMTQRLREENILPEVATILQSNF